MRTQTKSIVTALVLLSLVSGAVGCRSNGNGPWYNPKSYSWHNPFKEGNAPPYESEAPAHAATKPSLEAQPNVSTPPGGYANPGKESDFFANSNSPKTVQTQYGHGPAEATKVASNPYSIPESANITASYNAAPSSPEPYNPYASAEVPMNAMTSAYQPTRYYEQQNPMGAQSAPMADVQPVYGNPVGNPAGMQAAPSPYAPVPAANPVGAYAPQAPASPYANAQSNYGVPAATPYNVDPQAAMPAVQNMPQNMQQSMPAAGYMASPSTYQPTTSAF